MEYHKRIIYNPLQKLTEQYIKKDCNVVVLAPTSSGKTIVAEQFLFPCLEAGQKAVYLSPLKALTTEKLNEWSWLPYGIRALTGDYEQVTSVPEQMVLMTTESLDSKTRSQQSWLKKVGVLVSDESHMLCMPRRGDAFEVGLTSFTEMNPSARIIFLSATIPNAQELGSWLTILNGKPTEVVETSWRPVEQEHFLIEMPNKHWDFINETMTRIPGIRSRYKGLQTLIFVHSVNMGKQISKTFGLPFHYSKLKKEERAKLEKNFKEKKTNAIVSTSTLAYGVNLPADTGIIVGAHRGPMDVDPIDIKQEAGRIGRYGLSKRGYVYYLFKKEHAQSQYDLAMNVPIVKSVLEQRLYFHIVSFVARRKMDLSQMKTFVSNTLAGYQFSVEDRLESHIEKLLSLDILRGDLDYLYAGPVGRAAALMYLDPIDLYTLKNNLTKLPQEPELISAAFASLPSQAYEVSIPKDIESSKFFLEVGTTNQSVIASSLNAWLSGEHLTGTFTVIVPPYIADVERWTSGLKIAGLNKPYLENLELKLKNGVQEDLIDLVSLHGVGRKRALELSRLGIKSKEDIKANQRKAQNILPPKLFKDVLAQIEGKTILRF